MLVLSLNNNMYIVIFFILLIVELLYFRIADKFNIIDKPNERSSHTSVVLRGGGIIFLIGAWVWSLFYGFHYPWFLAGLTLVAGVSLVGGAFGVDRLCGYHECDQFHGWY